MWLGNCTTCSSVSRATNIHCLRMKPACWKDRTLSQSDLFIAGTRSCFNIHSMFIFLLQNIHSNFGTKWSLPIPKNTNHGPRYIIINQQSLRLTKESVSLEDESTIVSSLPVRMNCPLPPVFLLRRAGVRFNSLLETLDRLIVHLSISRRGVIRCQ